MSWFDTAGIASIAKSAKTALKEAQKTIDKALDIQEAQGIVFFAYLLKHCIEYTVH